ncbi:MAG TPA: helix-turn-helix transcriptional regulator [Pseudonocardiaceae bacterium]|jgi:transcriptional regulator with XRE-family HTH domain|nr:helix-turn-helix transcriptional regulator [Pseudonocardiaceae bacterium]
MVEPLSTARRRELGAELRRIREASGLNGVDMAGRLGWDPSMLSRAETGKRGITEIEIASYTGLCGLAGKQLTELLRLADEPDDYRVKPHNGLPDELRTLIFHEQTARAIENFQLVFIPGLTQTEDYARELFRDLGFDGQVAEDGVRNRLSRRSILTRPNPVLCDFYVHENALRTIIGGAQVMYEQMLHLLFLTNRPQCSIRVVPTSVGGRGMATGSFVIFNYPEGAPVVYVEHQTTCDFLESRRDLLGYRTALNRVASVALDEARSTELIASLASDYERRGAADVSGGVAEEQL